MYSTRTLVGGAVVVLAVAVVAAAVVPGVLADPTSDGPLNPGPVRAVDGQISTGSVSGQQAALTLHAVLAHHGNPTRNVSVRFRAVDTDSGLLVASETVAVGTLTGDDETDVNGTLTVPREGGYRLEAVVYRNGSRVDEVRRTVSGVGALPPAYARSNVSFVDDPVLQPIAVSVDRVSANATRISLGAWLSAVGPNRADDLSVTFVVRQAESNLVADRTSISARRLREGRTRMVEASVTVPSDYNYYVDAVLTRDGVVVDTATGVVNLDPTETVSRNESREEVEFDVEDFEDEGPSEKDGTRASTQTQESSPGFGPVVAGVALLGAGLLARRRR